MAGQQKNNAENILNIIWGYAKSRVLECAVKTEVFEHIAKGKKTVPQIAGAAKCSRRGLPMLLDALAGLGLLKKDKKQCYYLLPAARRFLLKGNPGYLGGLVNHTAHLAEIWSHLAESVRAGLPYVKVDTQKDAEEFFPELVKVLFDSNYPAAKYAASFLKNKNKKVASVLDVAAGSAVWGIGFAQAFRDATITALDFGGVLNTTREYVQRFHLQDRFVYLQGDLRTVDFGREAYDLVILGHICHSEGRKQSIKLLKKSFRALKKGGCLLIAEFLPNDAKTKPIIPLLFGLNMLLNTRAGDVFTIKQFRTWAFKAGFKKMSVLSGAPSSSPLIIALK